MYFSDFRKLPDWRSVEGGQAEFEEGRKFGVADRITTHKRPGTQVRSGQEWTGAIQSTTWDSLGWRHWKIRLVKATTKYVRVGLCKESIRFDLWDLLCSRGLEIIINTTDLETNFCLLSAVRQVKNIFCRFCVGRKSDMAVAVNNKQEAERTHQRGHHSAPHAIALPRNTGITHP